MVEIMKIMPEERVLFIINDNPMYGTARFQRYGFMLAKECQREIEMLEITNSGFKFYKDWEPRYSVPFSRQLEEDIKTCIDKKILKKAHIYRTPDGERNIDIYRLTVAGRRRWRDIFGENDCMKKLYDTTKNLQRISSVTLLGRVCNTYAKFTNDIIKNSS